MTVAINQPITKAEVVTPTPKPPERPDALSGVTYKVKTPLSEHALYITITDWNGRPFEMFINSKSMEHFQWIVALTRVVSAVFRHGGEVTFLVEELRSVFDPKGGYFKKGGRYMPSLVAEIGDVLEAHLTGLGLMTKDDSLAKAAQVMVAEKLESGAPGKSLCAKCGTKSVVILDGCATCLNCGESKCG